MQPQPAKGRIQDGPGVRSVEAVAALWNGHLYDCVCPIVGGLAIFGNGGEIYDNSFSTVLRTTRDRELDSLVRGDVSSGQPLSHGIGKTRDQPGNLRRDERAAFKTNMTACISLQLPFFLLS